MLQAVLCFFASIGCARKQRQISNLHCVVMADMVGRLMFSVLPCRGQRIDFEAYYNTNTLLVLRVLVKARHTGPFIPLVHGSLASVSPPVTPFTYSSTYSPNTLLRAACIEHIPPCTPPRMSTQGCLLIVWLTRGKKSPLIIFQYSIVLFR